MAGTPKQEILTSKDIVELIMKEKQYIFRSFHDDRIESVEAILQEREVDYIITSQIGDDFVVSILGSSFYKRFKGRE